MKKFIVLMIFAIGMLAMLPSTSSGSAPPGQVSFAAELPAIDLTFEVANLDLTANYEFSFVSYQTFEMAVLPEKGGFVADQGLFLVRQHLYLNDKKLIESTAFTNYNPDFRICRYSKQTESKIITQNIESRTRCTIRADSQA